MTRYYKLLKSDGTSPFTGTRWLLPRDDQPGEWMPPRDADRLWPCVYGYHACTADQLIRFWSAYEFDARKAVLYEVELAGRVLEDPDEHEPKCLASRARLLARTWKWEDIVLVTGPISRAYEEEIDQALEEYARVLLSGSCDEEMGQAYLAWRETRAQARQLRDAAETQALAGMGIT